MTAEIIAVGTELLLGQILNTNAKFIAQHLPEAGVGLYYQSVVGDNPERLKNMLETAFSRVDTVILTGGLGPTCDDLTKETVASFFKKRLVRDENSLTKIKNYFDSLGREMTENNCKQADMPEGCIILENNCGTAPGCIIEENGKTAIMLPGPPKEMEPMFMQGVMPYFKSKSNTVIYSETLRVLGIDGMGESKVEAMLRDLMQDENPSVAPYAKEGQVELRVTARAKTRDEAKRLIQPVSEEIERRLGKYVYGYNDDSIESVLINLLIKNKLKISTCESCTGGLIASAITEIAGSSKVFEYGFVTYANEAKENLVGVPHDVLEKFDAVSKETAICMARGAREHSGSDIGVSVTGIAGPGGGSAEKPVGLVYIAVDFRGETVCKQLNLSGSRAKIRNMTKINLFGLIIQLINERNEH